MRVPGSWLLYSKMVGFYLNLKPHSSASLLETLVAASKDSLAAIPLLLLSNFDILKKEGVAAAKAVVDNGHKEWLADLPEFIAGLLNVVDPEAMDKNPETIGTGMKLLKVFLESGVTLSEEEKEKVKLGELAQTVVMTHSLVGL